MKSGPRFSALRSRFLMPLRRLAARGSRLTLRKCAKLSLVGAFLIMSCMDLQGVFDAAANCAGDVFILEHLIYANGRVHSSSPAHRDRIQSGEFTAMTPEIRLNRPLDEGSLAAVAGCESLPSDCEVDLECGENDDHCWDGLDSEPQGMFDEMHIIRETDPLWGPLLPRMELSVSQWKVDEIMLGLNAGDCTLVSYFLRSATVDADLPLELAPGKVGLTEQPLKVTSADGSMDVGPFVTAVSLCKPDAEPPPNISLAGWLGPELQDRVFNSDPVPPHAPLVFNFDKDMAWATALVSFENGAEDLLSRQAFSEGSTQRFQIIPQDGLGFDPGTKLTLQMFDRTAPLQGFPYPPSSVSVDGQALAQAYLNEVPVGDVKIFSLGGVVEFLPPEFASLSNADFAVTVENPFPNPVGTLRFTVQSVDETGHPVLVGLAPPEVELFASELGITTAWLTPPTVRSGYGLIQISDADREEHFDYAFYNWDPPMRLLQPSDGETVLRDDPLVKIRLGVYQRAYDLLYEATQTSHDFVFSESPSGADLAYLTFVSSASLRHLSGSPAGTGCFEAAATFLGAPGDPLQLLQAFLLLAIFEPDCMSGPTTVTWEGAVDLDDGETTFVGTRVGDGHAIDARTVGLSTDTILAGVVAWKVCEDLGPPGLDGSDLAADGSCVGSGSGITDAEIRAMFDRIDVPPVLPETITTLFLHDSVDDIWQQAGIQLHLAAPIGAVLVDASNAETPQFQDTNGNGRIDNADVEAWLAVHNPSHVSGAVNVYFVSGLIANGVSLDGLAGDDWVFARDQVPLESRQTVAHEIGHVFGLDHPEDDPATPENSDDCNPDTELIGQINTHRLMIARTDCDGFPDPMPEVETRVHLVSQGPESFNCGGKEIECARQGAQQFRIE